jgi:hypothetical protein
MNGSFWAGIGFEHRASNLLDKPSITWATLEQSVCVCVCVCVCVMQMEPGAFHMLCVYFTAEPRPQSSESPFYVLFSFSMYHVPLCWKCI